MGKHSKSFKNEYYWVQELFTNILTIGLFIGTVVLFYIIGLMLAL